MKNTYAVLLMLCLLSFSCTKEFEDDDGAKAYKLTIKGNIKDSNRQTIKDDIMLILYNDYSSIKNACTQCESEMDDKGNYEVSILIKKGEERSAQLHLSPFFCIGSNMYGMQSNRPDNLRGEALFDYPDFEKLSKKGDYTIHKNLIINPLGVLLLDIDVPEGKRGSITYKTLNYSNNKVQEIKEGNFSGHYTQSIRALANQKLEVTLQMKEEDGTLIKEIAKTYYLKKFQILTEKYSIENFN